MKFSYGVEIEGMALEKDYNKIKEFLHYTDMNYFITGDQSVQVSDDLIDLTYTLDGQIQDVIPFEIHVGPFTWPNEGADKLSWILFEMATNGALTNDTCAFHMHIKPHDFELYSKQAHWASHLMLAYLIETDRYRRLLYYNNQKMYHHFWASVSDMLKEYKSLKKNIKKNSRYFLEKRKTISNKRGLFHCHPQGTLEWRGIRGMFDTNPRAYFKRESTTFEESVSDKWNFARSIFRDISAAFDPDQAYTDCKVHYQLLGMERDVLKQNSH